MLNAKRIFFIILSNVGIRLFRRGIYSTSNSQNASASRVFERAHAEKHPSTNRHELISNQKRTNHGCPGWGSARGSRAGFGSLAETIFYSATKHTNATEIF